MVLWMVCSMMFNKISSLFSKICTDSFIFFFFIFCILTNDLDIRVFSIQVQIYIFIYLQTKGFFSFCDFLTFNHFFIKDVFDHYFFSVTNILYLHFQLFLSLVAFQNLLMSQSDILLFGVVFSYTCLATYVQVFRYTDIFPELCLFLRQIQVNMYFQTIRIQLALIKQENLLRNYLLEMYLVIIKWPRRVRLYFISTNITKISYTLEHFRALIIICISYTNK